VSIRKHLTGRCLPVDLTLHRTRLQTSTLQVWKSDLTERSSILICGVKIIVFIDRI
jgi:hypothetical protein